MAVSAVISMPIPVDDPCPSTLDYSVLDLDVDGDPVLAILRNARDRIEKKWSRRVYVRKGAVCAVGAIWASDHEARRPRNVSIENYFRFDDHNTYDAKVTEGAKVALKLLDKVAKTHLKTHNKPTHISWGRQHRLNNIGNGKWIETVNQTMTKADVLECYARAIEIQKGC